MLPKGTERIRQHRQERDSATTVLESTIPRMVCRAKIRFNRHRIGEGE